MATLGTISRREARIHRRSAAVIQRFSAEILDAGGLTNGDLAIINASTSGSGPPPAVPEPATWTMLGTGLLGLAGTARRRGPRMLRVLGSHGRPMIAAMLGCVLLAIPAMGQVKLNSLTSPSSGASGTTTVSVTGSGYPAGTILPSGVTVSLAPVCGGSATTTGATAVIKVIGSSEKVEFLIPASLATGTYFVSVSGSTTDSTSFNSGTTCSALQVTHTTSVLASCLPSSSLAVLSGTQVTAYVPKGSWGGSITGIQVVGIEGGGSPVSIATPHVVNSCSANAVTGKTVCVANNTDVYTISGTSITNTLTSGATGSTSFSGGTAQNTGVFINALTNTAFIGEGVVGSPSGAGLQSLNLAGNIFGTPFKSKTAISENMAIDPTRNLIFSPNEGQGYTLYQLDSVGNLTEFDSTIGVSTDLDSASEDCTTGIALSTQEFTGNLVIADVNQATFTPPVSPSTVGTWTAPHQTVNFPEFDNFSAGTSGISIAPGSTHLGIVTGEFGGNTFGVFQLPGTPGTGGTIPSFVDYAAAVLPTEPNGAAFSSGLDPHTITAYTSPNNGKAYGLMSDGAVNYIAVIDLQALLSAPRTTGTHNVSPSVNLLASGIVRYVAAH